VSVLRAMPGESIGLLRWAPAFAAMGGEPTADRERTAAAPTREGPSRSFVSADAFGAFQIQTKRRSDVRAQRREDGTRGSLGEVRLDEGVARSSRRRLAWFISGSARPAR
jgi:hypothetical protein